MKIFLNSVFVDDQDKALKFYTEVLGFVKKLEIPMGEFKWLTVVSPEDPDGTELLLEPNSNPSANTFQEDIFMQGIPATSFSVEDIEGECKRLKKMGVEFTIEPNNDDEVKMAVFNDTCGNLIQIVEL